MNKFPVTPPLGQNHPMPVIIIDDHTMIASLVTQVLELEGKYRVMGRAENARQAVELCRRTRPLLVILDIVLPDSKNLDCLRQVRALCPAARVLVFSGNLQEKLVRDILLLGADGIIGKSASLPEFLEAVNCVSSGRTYLCPSTSETVRAIVTSATARPGQDPMLSRRELSVLRHIAAGASTREIAVKLGVSQNTINAFRGRLMKKTGLHGAVNLSLYALRRGLLGSGFPQAPGK